MDSTCRLGISYHRINDCSVFKKNGYICQALDVKCTACNPTQTFPDLVTSAIYQDGFPLPLASDESVQKVGDEIDR